MVSTNIYPGYICLTRLPDIAFHQGFLRLSGWRSYRDSRALKEPEKGVARTSHTPGWSSRALCIVRDRPAMGARDVQMVYLKEALLWLLSSVLDMLR